MSASLPARRVANAGGIRFFERIASPSHATRNKPITKNQIVFDAVQVWSTETVTAL